MTERQQERQAETEAASGAASVGKYVAEVESVDGNAVRLEANGTDTIAEIRRVALDQLGALTNRADKYVVMSSSGRVLRPADTVDDVLAQNETLSLQLVPQAAFGA